MLSFERLCKSYRSGPTEVHALKGVSGSVAAGTSVALCGPSGSGKSTLLNICGLLDPNYTGDVFLDGQKVSTDARVRTRLRREKIGFVFQRYNLIPVMTAFENIEYPLLMLSLSQSERYRRVAEIIDGVGLAKYARLRPDQLSGGQQQRVAVARALIKRPTLVIADEPTANLDTDTAHQVIDLMRGLGRELGSTFLIATHDSRMTDRCDSVLALRDGLLDGVNDVFADKPTAHDPLEVVCAG